MGTVNKKINQYPIWILDNPFEIEFMKYIHSLLVLAEYRTRFFPFLYRTILIIWFHFSFDFTAGRVILRLVFQTFSKQIFAIKSCWHVPRLSHMQLEVYMSSRPVDPTARPVYVVLVLIAQDSPTHSSWNSLCCHAKRVAGCVEANPNSIPILHFKP